MAKTSHRASTRRAVLSAGIAATLAASSTGPASTTRPALRPTKLGLELLRLLPPHAEATWHACNLVDVPGHPEYDAARVTAVEERETATWNSIVKAIDAILEAATDAPPTQHLADLSIAVHLLDMEGCVPSEQQVAATRAMFSTLLAMASVPEDACCARALYEAVED